MYRASYCTVHNTALHCEVLIWGHSHLVLTLSFSLKLYKIILSPKSIDRYVACCPPTSPPPPHPPNHLHCMLISYYLCIRINGILVHRVSTATASTMASTISSTIASTVPFYPSLSTPSTVATYFVGITITYYRHLSSSICPSVLILCCGTNTIATYRHLCVLHC